MPMDAVPVVLVERVHDRSRLQYQQRDSSGYPPSSTMASPLISRDRPRPSRQARAQGISRAKPLVSGRIISPEQKDLIPVECAQPDTWHIKNFNNYNALVLKYHDCRPVEWQ